MIKVLNIISDTNIGGAGKCLITYCKNYDKDKFEISVLIPKNSLLKKYLEETDVKIIEIDGIKDKSFDLKAIKKICNIIEKEKPNIIHTHSSLSGRIAASKFKDIKIVYTKHCVFPPSPKYKYGIVKKLNKILTCKLADKIIATADIAKEHLIYQGVPEDMIQVVLNGTDGLIKSNRDDINLLREKYGIEENDKVIGYLARLDKIKGHEYYIKAAKIICDKYGKNYKFLIIGTGDYESELKGLVKQLDLENQVIFTGFIKEVSKILSILDIQVNASFVSETTNLALLEGMSIGVPSVATDCGGTKNVVNTGVNGILIQKQDEDDLAKGIMWLLKDEEKYKEMQQKSIEIFNERFTSIIYTKNIEKIYESMVNKNENN